MERDPVTYGRGSVSERVKREREKERGETDSMSYRP